MFGKELAEAGEEADALSKPRAPAAVVRRGLEEPDESGQMLNQSLFGRESVPGLAAVQELSGALAKLLFREALVNNAPGEQAKLRLLDLTRR